MLERAAGQARRMFDLDLAARLARAALEAGGGVGAGLVLGEAEFRSGRHTEAEQVLAGLVPICRDDTDLALVANAHAYNFGVLMGDYVGASAVVDEALGAVSDPGARLRLVARQAQLWLFGGDPQAALTAAAQLLETDDEGMISRGTYAASLALALQGRCREAVAQARADSRWTGGAESRTRSPKCNWSGRSWAMPRRAIWPRRRRTRSQGTRRLWRPTTKRVWPRSASCEAGCGSSRVDCRRPRGRSSKALPSTGS